MFPIRIFRFSSLAQPAASLNKVGPIRRIKPSVFAQDTKPLFRIPTVPSPDRPSVKAFCTSEAYDLPGLRKGLAPKYTVSPFISEDVFHCKVEGSEAFFFENGSFVFWPCRAEVDQSDLLEELIQTVKRYEIGPVNERETEELDFVTEPCKEAHLDGETIVLPQNDDSPVMTKLAFANGLADSVKLATLEAYLQDHIEKVKHIPSQLQREGKIDLKRSQVLQLIGELLHFRALLNLHSELIDTPELYWSEANLETIYLKTLRLLETRTRINVLNKKLDYANEMAQFLRSHLSEQHGLKLEWGIIALIAVEVLFELAHYL